MIEKMSGGINFFARAVNVHSAKKIIELAQKIIELAQKIKELAQKIAGGAGFSAKVGEIRDFIGEKHYFVVNVLSFVKKSLILHTKLRTVKGLNRTFRRA